MLILPGQHGRNQGRAQGPIDRPDQSPGMAGQQQTRTGPVLMTMTDELPILYVKTGCPWCGEGRAEDVRS